MRILLITNDWYPKQGGISTYLTSLVNNLNYQVTIYGPSWIEGESTVRSSYSFIMPYKKVFTEILDIVNKEKIETIILGSSNPQFLLVSNLLKLNIPIYMIAHGAEFNILRYVPLLSRVLKKAMDAVTEVYTISSFSLRKLKRFTKSKVKLIGAGVESNEFIKQREDTDEESIIIGVCSRFVPRKKIDWVMEVCSQLSQEGYKLKVAIYGQGRLEKKLKKLSELISVETVFYSDSEGVSIQDFYKGIDIFAMPAHSRFFGLEYEGLGLVYLEAASYGIPVITGSSGGAPETIIPGKTGFVADTKEHLLEGIKYFLDDTEKISEYGQAGKIFVQNNFSWEKVSEKI